ncbi:MAG TPA: cupin domain-containing protein [Burkholderiaceae bacterium]|nr:cupin domain-containing protein [Burkholderiaceae bacterium]
MKTPNAPVSRLLLIVLLCGSTALWALEMPAPLQATEIQWGAAPPVFPPGAKMAVLAGNPAGSGPVTIRLQIPPGYRLAAHWHPTDEHVTVISGSFAIGMGDKLDRKQSKVLDPGGYAIAVANMHHYAWTDTGAVVQVNLMGPFQITYVDPMDDPTAKK